MKKKQKSFKSLPQNSFKPLVLRTLNISKAQIFVVYSEIFEFLKLLMIFFLK